MVFTQACQREFEVCGLHGRRLLVGCWWKLGWGLFLKYSDLLWFPLKWPAKIKGRGKNLRLFSLVYCCQRYLKSFQRFFLPFFFLHVVNSGHACIWRLSKDKLEKLSSLKKQQKLCFDVLGASTAASPQRASIVLALVKQLFVGPHYKTKNRSDFQMKNKSKNMGKEITSTYLSICKDQEKKGICDGVSSLPPELTAQRWQLHGMAPERAGQVGFDIPCIPCANPRGQQKVSHCNQGELAQSKHRARPKPLTSLPKKKRQEVGVRTALHYCVTNFVPPRRAAAGQVLAEGNYTTHAGSAQWHSEDTPGCLSCFLLCAVDSRKREFSTLKILNYFNRITFEIDSG